MCILMPTLSSSQVNPKFIQNLPSSMQLSMKPQRMGPDSPEATMIVSFHLLAVGLIEF